MNDRFKFRVWVKETKKFVFFDLLSLPMTLPSAAEAWGNELTQSTALKDAHGKLIFEGDILRLNPTWPLDEGEEWPEYWRPKTCKVVWCGEPDHYAAFDTEPRLDEESNSLQMAVDGLVDEYETCEVIGNIYENPDLLEGNMTDKANGAPVDGCIVSKDQACRYGDDYTWDEEAQRWCPVGYKLVPEEVQVEEEKK